MYNNKKVPPHFPPHIIVVVKSKIIEMLLCIFCVVIPIIWIPPFAWPFVMVWWAPSAGLPHMNLAHGIGVNT